MYESAMRHSADLIPGADVIRRTAPIPIEEENKEKAAEESTEAMETDDKPVAPGEKERRSSISGQSSGYKPRPSISQETPQCYPATTWSIFTSRFNPK
jgi:hypothetical protein